MADCSFFAGALRLQITNLNTGKETIVTRDQQLENAQINATLTVFPIMNQGSTKPICNLTDGLDFAITASIADFFEKELWAQQLNAQVETDAATGLKTRASLYSNFGDEMPYYKVTAIPYRGAVLVDPDKHFHIPRGQYASGQQISATFGKGTQRSFNYGIQALRDPDRDGLVAVIGDLDLAV
jgi:hypothetical protein